MSVLFKALERAADENRRHDAGKPPSETDPERHLLSARRRPPPRRRLGMLLLSVVGIPLVAVLVSALAYPRETQWLLDDLIGLVVAPPVREPLPAPLDPETVAAPAPMEAEAPAVADTEPLPESPAGIAAASASDVASPAVATPAVVPVADAGPAPTEFGDLQPMARAAAPAETAASPPARATRSEPVVASAAPVAAPVAAPAPVVPGPPAPPLPPPRPIEQLRPEPPPPPDAQAVSAPAAPAAPAAMTSVATREAPQAVKDRMHVAGRLLIGRDLAAARFKYEEVLAIEPRNLSALFGRALALHLDGWHDEARAAYARLLEIDPRNEQAEANYLTLLAEVDGTEALAVMKRLAAANPDSAALQAGIGMTEARAGNVPEAVAHLRAAIARDPENGALRLNLAVVLDRAGRREEALAAYRAALELAADPRAPLPLPVEQVRNRMRFLAVGG